MQGEGNVDAQRKGLMGGTLIIVGILLLACAGFGYFMKELKRAALTGPVEARIARDQREKERKRFGILKELEAAEARADALRQEWKDRVDENRRAE